MSWSKPSAPEASWREDAERSQGYELITAAQLGVDSLGVVVVSARSRSVNYATSAAKWSHTARLPVLSLAVPGAEVLDAVNDRGPGNYGAMKFEIERRALPVALVCGDGEGSILDALISRDERQRDPKDLDYFIRLAGALSAWLALPPLARRKVLSHPSVEGRLEYRAANFLSLVRIIKLLEHSDDIEQLERPPIVLRATKNQPVGGLNIRGMRGAYRQGRSGSWGNIDTYGDIMVPLSELHIPDNATLQEFRTLFAEEGCTNEELLAFIEAAAQPIEAVGGNSLVNLTQWAQVGESLLPTLADASRASIIQHYLQMPPDKRALQFGPTGRVNFYGMRMIVDYQPPLKIEPFLARMAATLGVKRKPSGKK